MCSYVGGKSRIGKEIVDFIIDYCEKHNKTIAKYWEPFVGMCGTMRHMHADKKVGSDIHGELIEMWQALQNGWIPPKHVSKKEFMEMKSDKKSPGYLRAFVGHGYSYSGLYFAVYKKASGRDFGKEAYNGIMKVVPAIQDVKFVHESYNNAKMSKIRGWIIYCDPPYVNTAPKIGRNYVSKFDHEKFWNWVRAMSKHNTVFVSELEAPKDFKVIWQKSRFPLGKELVEKLFIVKK